MKKSLTLLELCLLAILYAVPFSLYGRDSLCFVINPIHDYIEKNEEKRGARDFLTGIHDLTVFDGRLYIGYGDANLNLGRVTPIEIKSFDGDSIVSEFITDDEQIDLFRRLDTLLAIPGVDATEDAWLGNVYLRAGGQWRKYRSVPNAVHVHDIALWNDEIYAVGSGSSMEEWNSGIIFGHLWKMLEDSFVIVDRIPNTGSGDCRFISLLSLADKLLIFGYRTNPEYGGIDSIFHLRWMGDSLVPFPFPKGVFVKSTWPSGHVLGVDLASEKQRLFLINADTTLEISIDENWDLVDIYESYLLFSKKDSIKIISIDNMEKVLYSNDKPLSIAVFNEDIYIGSKKGNLYRLDNQINTGK